MRCPAGRGSRWLPRTVTAFSLAGLAGLVWATGLVGAHSATAEGVSALPSTDDRASLSTSGSTPTTVRASTSTTAPKQPRSRVRHMTPTTTAARRAPAPAPSRASQRAAPATPPSPTPDELCGQGVASVAWPGGWNVVCAGTRAGLLGLTSPSGVTYLYVRGSFGAADYRSIALHEAGHAWAFSALTTADEGRWCQVRGCAGELWMAGGAQGAGWREPPIAEDWAESWRHCHGGPYERAYLGLGAPSAELCARQNALVR